MARSKEAIKKDVVDQLYWDTRVDASDVTVEVEDSGKVILSGKVPTYSARIAAFNTSLNIDGVYSVENNIEVKYALEVPSDEEIKLKVENNLFWNTLIDESNIDVEVDNGLVTLKGTVDMYWKRDRAEELADVNGVVLITNEIAIVPTEKRVDKDIAEDITAALDRDLTVNVNDVEVRVKDSKVTLSGTVPSWSAYRSAEDTAFYTLGVIEVENNLTIGG